MESISSSSLAKLMNNRPQVYTKRVNSLDSDTGNSNEKTKNRKQGKEVADREAIISQLTDKKVYTQDTTKDKGFIHNERLEKSHKNKYEYDKLQKEIAGARTVASYYDAEVFLISDADGEKLLSQKIVQTELLKAIS